MSRKKARSAGSYDDEVKATIHAVKLLRMAGFSRVTARKDGMVKMVDATAADGGVVTFWIKVGWSQQPHAAVMFGLFRGPEGSQKPNSEFVKYVKDRVRRMKHRGITHALLIHADDFAVATAIDDVASAYSEQMRRFPKDARNTKSPTMWFYDPRPAANDELTHIVMKRAIPLELLAARSTTSADEPEAKSRIGLTEQRVVQRLFRNRVGDRSGWRCAVTGSVLKETLEAAHLKGKDWRKHNEATDGIMLRVDIHRLWDCGLAKIVRGKFRVQPVAWEEYGDYDGNPIG